jgi:hypothetical protein
MKTWTPFIAVLSFFILLGAGACEDCVEPSRTFIIRKGDHFSSTRVSESLQSDVLEFDAMFDSTAIYDLGDDALQSSKNKLLGFSDCNSLHHENSARFAWQWLNNRLEIYAYTYVNATRQEAFIGVVKIGQFNRYVLSVQKDYYQFQLNNGNPVNMPRGHVCNQGIYYKLWPYFGGSVPAPHDVHIVIKDTY